MTSSTDRELRYCFVFVCQEGELELKAMLLAASLKRYLQCAYELVAAEPTPAERWGRVSEAGRRFLNELGVRFVPITNGFEPPYPLANKIACLEIETDADKVVFLDSDILCTRTFRHDGRFRTPINVKPADIVSFTADIATWERVYKVAGGPPLPPARVRATFSNEEMPPYFNSGVVAAPAGSPFPAEWRKCTQAIIADEQLNVAPHWREQTGLPVALAKLGLAYDCLDETYNYPVHIRPLDPERLPIFAHYHTPDVIAREPILKALVADLARKHAVLAVRLRGSRNWRPLLRAPGTGSGEGVVRKARDVYQRVRGATFVPLANQWARMITPAEARQRNTIVTGIPRSGTSLFSALLNRIENVVCLNEIYNTPYVFWLYHTLRKKINRGDPIPNKFRRDGDVATNTIEAGTEIRREVVRVRDASFVIAQKYTIPYLNRLPQLVSQGWPIWCVVRHPAFAISSWKRCPPGFPIVNLDPPDPQFYAVNFTSKDPEQRRIDIWNHYARIIDACRAGIHLVRYEDLVADVHKELGRFCEAHGVSLPADLEPLQTRNRPGQYEGMDEAFVQRILERCEMQRFGYDK